MTVPELMIGAVPVLLLIIALVEVIKTVLSLEDVDGKTHRGVPLIGIVLGVLFTVGIHLSTLFPAFGEWYEMIVAGIVVGLAAIGLYSGTRHALNIG